MAHVMHGQARGGTGGGRSPLPSLEQLRARLLQERASAGLNRSASTSAASAAARQYAMDKLLGGSFREGAVSPVSDTAEEQEDEGRRRSSVVKVDRLSLRRSRTIGGLSASAEAHRKAAFAQAIDEGIPDDLRSARRSSRRFAHAPPGRSLALPSSDTPMPIERGAPEPTPAGEGTQRQIARTEMLRKLSTRRGARSPANALEVAPEKAAEPVVIAAQDEKTFATQPHALTEASMSQLHLSTSQAPPDVLAATSARKELSHRPNSPLNNSLNRSYSPASQGTLLAVPQGRITRSSSVHSSNASGFEEDRRRVSELARLNGEAAFEYERLLEMGYTTDDAYERVSSARSGSFRDNVSQAALSPRSAQGEFGGVAASPTEAPTTPQLVSPARMLLQKDAAAKVIASPGNSVPVNVSPPLPLSPPVPNSPPSATKHCSEASIPLGFAPGMVADSKSDLLVHQTRDSLKDDGQASAQAPPLPATEPPNWPPPARVQHDRNTSITSTIALQQPDDLSLALDTGRASNPLPTLTAPASLAPGTAAVLHRYSRMLTAPSLSATMPSIPGLSAQQLDNPPRRYIMSSPVLQVVTASTVKDRFVFLFSDLIVFAKPVRAPPHELDTHALPTLTWSFSAKSILPLSEIKLTMPKNERRQNAVHTPLMETFVGQFAEAPRSAVTALIEHTGLTHDPTTIAKLLHQTPDLDRQKLSEYLFGTHEGAAQVMRAFVYQEKFAGVSIESALRSLLLEIRFPPRREQIEEMLVYFAQQWVETNHGLIKDTFTARLACDLVFVILSLNDALHSHHADVPGYFSGPNAKLEKDMFVSIFRRSDPGEVLSDRTLSRIFSSVSSDVVQQARLPRTKDDAERRTVRILTPGVPTRIVYGVQSDVIRIAIPRADPGFSIRLYGQNLSFHPQILSFDKTHVQEFRVSSKSLGTHTIVFVRAGRNASLYKSVQADVGEDYVLPRWINVAVQRAFMQHCFTLTQSGRRRFLVSVEDEARRKLWLRAIKERLDATQRKAAANPTAKDSGSAQSLALSVLKETLIQPDVPAVPLSLQRSASSAAGGGSGSSAAASPYAALKLGLGRAPSDSRALQHPLHGIGAAAMGMHNGISNGGGASNAAVNRQESISKHYYGAKGLGHSERELLPNGGVADKRDGLAALGRGGIAAVRGGAVVEPMTGEELILTVKQNSLLTLVIAHAQQQQQQQQQQQHQISAGHTDQQQQQQPKQQQQQRYGGLTNRLVTR